MEGDDPALLAAVCDGSERAFNTLIDRHQQAVRIFLRGIAGREEADDIAQETFLAVWTHARSYRGQSSVLHPRRFQLDGLRDRPRSRHQTATHWGMMLAMLACIRRGNQARVGPRETMSMMPTRSFLMNVLCFAGAVRCETSLWASASGPIIPADGEAATLL